MNYSNGFKTSHRDDIFTQQEKARDYYTKVSKSDVRLEQQEGSSELGFSGFILDSLYADFIFAEFVDIDEGFKEEGGLLVTSKEVGIWRKARILMVSPWVASSGNTKIGDIVVFPNDKGLRAGQISYRDENGVIKTTRHGIFLNEARFFAKVSPDTAS